MDYLSKSICAFGDSVLKGVVLDKDTNKYQEIENNFAKLSCSAFGLEITNYGKFGSTISVVEKSFERYQEQLKKFQYVVFECGGNDCDFNWSEIAENPDTDHYPKSSISDFTEKFVFLIDRVKSMGKIPILLSLPPIDAERYFSYLSEKFNKENLLKWLEGCVQVITNWHERYNLQVFKIARENDVDIIDITSTFLDMKDYRKCLCSDGIHPNEFGHSIIAHTIENFIEKRFGLSQFA